MPVSEQARSHLKECLGDEYAVDYPHNLERQFPHVFEKISRLWGSPEMGSLFNDLLITKRVGRQGFPVSVVEEILRLYRDYQKLGLAAREPQQPGDVWGWVGKVDYFEPKRHT
jgi:hypothetical protein